jgi:hypothetical protein
MAVQAPVLSEDEAYDRSLALEPLKGSVYVRPTPTHERTPAQVHEPAPEQVTVIQEQVQVRELREQVQWLTSTLESLEVEPLEVDDAFEPDAEEEEGAQRGPGEDGDGEETALVRSLREEVQRLRTENYRMREGLHFLARQLRVIAAGGKSVLPTVSNSGLGLLRAQSEPVGMMMVDSLSGISLGEVSSEKEASDKTGDASTCSTCASFENVLLSSGRTTFPNTRLVERRGVMRPAPVSIAVTLVDDDEREGGGRDACHRNEGTKEVRLEEITEEEKRQEDLEELNGLEGLEEVLEGLEGLDEGGGASATSSASSVGEVFSDSSMSVL